MNAHHLIKVRFDRRFAGATQEWFNHRVKFFMENTYKSLLNQTVKDWAIWVNFDDETTMKMVWPLLDPHYGSGLMTFAPRGDEFKGFWSAGDGPVKLPSLDVFKPEHVYVTRIDSDDLFAPDALECVRAVKPSEPGAVETSIFARGYIHDMNTGLTGTYLNPSSPFHTIMFPREVFTNPVEYAKVWHKVGDHSMVRSSGYKCHVLPDYKFTVLIHGNNFLSDFDYRRDVKEPNEPGWTIERFLNQPVIFDVDDYCDRHASVINDLDQLKDTYPNFRCTLFTIPEETCPRTLAHATTRPWIEVAYHGMTHSPNEELKELSTERLRSGLLYYMKSYPQFTHGFRPPGWYIKPDQVKMLADLGMWTAIHYRDRETLGQLAHRGYYACGDRWPYWHGHTHNVCNNWVRAHLSAEDKLLTKWPRDQRFGWVSEAILVPPRRAT